MKNANTGTIQWCEPDNNRRRATATMYEDGTLRFGAEMCEIFRSRKIRIGFFPNECALVVEINAERGFILPKTGETKVSSVTVQLRQLNIELPVGFLFYEEVRDTCWKGHIIPLARKANQKKPKKVIPTAEHHSMLNAYKWLIDRVVCNYAKSTPSDERRAMAVEAFIEALHDYAPMYGTLKDYLFSSVKSRLIEHNKYYTRINQFKLWSGFFLALVRRIDYNDTLGYCILE